MGTPATPSGAEPTVAVAVTVPQDPTEGGKYCGSDTKRKKYPFCHQPAGFRTAHKGVGRCYLHGGRTQLWLSRDRYKPLKIGRLGELIDHFDQDPDPTDTLPEIIALRALFADFCERYQATTAALLAWHASYQQTQRPIAEDLVIAFARCIDECENWIRDTQDPTEGQIRDLEEARIFLKLLRTPPADVKPRVVMDISDASRIVDRITVAVERLKEQQGSVSRQVLKRILEQMARSVRTRVPDPAIIAAIRADWRAIEIPL